MPSADSLGNDLSVEDAALRKKIDSLFTGCAVMYKKPNGDTRPAEVIRVDRTIYPPSYTVIFTDGEGGERSTEHMRLIPIPGQTPPKPPKVQPNSGPAPGGGAPEAALVKAAQQAAAEKAARGVNPYTPMNPKIGNSNIPFGGAHIPSLTKPPKDTGRKFCSYFMKGEKCPLGPSCTAEHSLHGSGVIGAGAPSAPAGGFNINASRDHAKQRALELYQKAAGGGEAGPQGQKPRSLSQLLQAGAKAEEEKKKRDKVQKDQREKQKANFQCSDCGSWNPRSEDYCTRCGLQSPDFGKPWRCEACGNVNGRARLACNGKRTHRCSLDQDCKVCNSGEECGKKNPNLKRRPVTGGASPGKKRARSDEPSGKAKPALPSPPPAGPITGTVERWDVQRCAGVISADEYAAEAHVDRRGFAVGADAPTAHLIKGLKVQFKIAVGTAGPDSFVAKGVAGDAVTGVAPLDRLQGWWLRPGGKAPCSVKSGGAVVWENKTTGPKLSTDDQSRVHLNEWILAREEHARGVRKLHWSKSGSDTGDLRTWYGHPWPVLEVPAAPRPVPTPPLWKDTQQRLVFLMLGEANMAGRGRDPTQEPHCNRCWVYNNVSEWTPGAEPVHPFDGRGQGVGPGIAFARRLADALPGTGIFLVPCAAGPSSVMDWQEGLPLFEAAVARARLACRSADANIAGVLWGQGETDAAPDTWALCKGYTDPLKQVVVALRRRLQASAVPFVAAQLGAHLERCDEDPRPQRPSMWHTVNKAIAAATGRSAGTVGALPCSTNVSAEGLTGEGLFLDTPGQRELGKRLADGWLSCSGTPDGTKYRDGKGGKGGQDEPGESRLRPQVLPDAPPLPNRVPEPVSSAVVAAGTIVCTVAGLLTVPTLPPLPPAPAPAHPRAAFPSAPQLPAPPQRPAPSAVSPAAVAAPGGDAAASADGAPQSKRQRKAAGTPSATPTTNGHPSPAAVPQQR